MKYQIKATQTIYKYFPVEADSRDEALEKAQTMAEEGVIRFDDEPFLNIDVQIELSK